MADPEMPGVVRDLLLEEDVNDDAVAAPAPARRFETSSSDEDEAGGNPPCRPTVAPSCALSP